jgi:hypothetical protein
MDRTEGRGPRRGLGGAGPSTGATPPAPDPDAIAAAIRTGYSLIEENIQRGREIGQSFRRGEYSAAEVPADARRALRSLVSAGRDFAAALFEVLDTVLAGDPPAKTAEADVKDQALWPPLYGPAPAFYPAPPAPAAPATTAALGPTLVCIRNPSAKGDAPPVVLQRPPWPLSPSRQLVVRAEAPTGALPQGLGVRFRPSLPPAEEIIADLDLAQVAAGDYVLGVWQVTEAGEAKLGVLALKVLP